MSGTIELAVQNVPPGDKVMDVSFVRKNYFTVGNETRLQVQVSRWTICFRPGSLTSPGHPIAVYKHGTDGYDDDDEPVNLLATLAEARDWLRKSWLMMDGQ